MAAPQGNLANPLGINDFQLQLSDIKRDGYTHNELLSWLQEKGIRTSDKTLRRRLQIWGVSSRRPGTEVDLNSGNPADKLVERVNYLFHYTILSDSQIAIKIAEEDRL
jgi:hypothetical protein